MWKMKMLFASVWCVSGGVSWLYLTSLKVHSTLAVFAWNIRFKLQSRNPTPIYIHMLHPFCEHPTGWVAVSDDRDDTSSQRLPRRFAIIIDPEMCAHGETVQCSMLYACGMRMTKENMRLAEGLATHTLTHRHTHTNTHINANCKCCGGFRATIPNTGDWFAPVLINVGFDGRIEDKEKTISKVYVI